MMSQLGLSCESLAHDDDLATAVIVDSALGFQTHKMQINYSAPRGQTVNIHAVRKLLRKVHQHGDVEAACDELLTLYLRNAYADLRTPERKVD